MLPIGISMLFTGGIAHADPLEPGHVRITELERIDEVSITYDPVKGDCQLDETIELTRERRIEIEVIDDGADPDDGEEA